MKQRGKGPSLRPRTMWLGYNDDADVHKRKRSVIFLTKREARAEFSFARKIRVQLLPHIFPVIR